jgi:PKD repeat protein
MTATNSGGSNTVTKDGYVTVSQDSVAPTASFVATTTSGLTPLTVKFVDTSINGPTSWVWTFGDGNSEFVQNPTHTYTSEGTYTVTLTATNSIGSSTATKLDYIFAELDEPIASFSADVTSGTAPLIVQFNDTSQNAPTSWAWNFGDDTTSNLQNPLHRFTSAGSYSIILTVRNSVGSNTTSISKYINVSALTAPEASFTASPTSGMAPLTVRFTDTSINYPAAWQWTFGDGTSSSEQNPSHTYQGSGTYTVVLTATNSQGSGTKTLQDVISVTGLTTATTATPVPPEVTVAETQVTAVTTTSPAEVGSTGTSSLPIIPILIVIAAVVIIGILIMRRRPPRAHHGSRRGDL